MSSLKSLTFAWWNTGLAPSAKTRSTPDDRATTCLVLSRLITQTGADFIALGEMSELDLEYIARFLKAFDFEVRSGITKAGRAKFDMCYAYNRNKLAILKLSDITDEKGNSTLRIAQMLTLATAGDQELIYVLASHWPSRLHCHSEDSNRHIYGLRLRDKFTELLKEEDPNAFIIMLGDYNDEPFDKSLAHQLMASRDLDQVKRKKYLLYNPFWQQLCKRTPERVASGSYFYKGGEVTKWYTFDQIIFSHAFLTSDTWTYAHSSDLVHELPELIELVMHSDTNFDHLPVYGRIERTNQNG